MSTATQRKPSYSTRHRSRNATLEAAVWENEGDKGSWYSVTLTKSWKQGEEWKHSSANFPVWDLLPASKLLEFADFYIGHAREKGAEASDGVPIAAKKRGRLECAIWHDVNGDRDYYNVTLKRSYQSGTEWKDTRVSLDANELLEAGRLLTRCFDAIDELSAKPSSTFVDSAKQTFDATENAPTDDDIPF